MKKIVSVNHLLFLWHIQVLQWDQSSVALNLLLCVTKMCGLYQSVGADHFPLLPHHSVYFYAASTCPIYYLPQSKDIQFANVL